MSPGTRKSTMSSLLSTTSSSNTLNAPKLCDDGSNWSDYHARIKVEMEAKGLWKHVEGIATPPKPYAEVNGVAVLADGKTEATEEQIEARECRIDEFGRAASMAKHVILSTTSAWLGMKIKLLPTAKEMWELVKRDTTSKGTLFLVDVKCQLEGMQLAESSDPKTHLTELKAHFKLMLSRHKNLMEMGSTFSDQRLITLITSSLPNSYRPALQTLTAADRAAKMQPTSTSHTTLTQTSPVTLAGMSPHQLVDYFVEEAEHRLTEDTRTKESESTMHAQSKKGKGHN